MNPICESCRRAKSMFKVAFPSSRFFVCARCAHDVTQTPQFERGGIVVTAL